MKLVVGQRGHDLSRLRMNRTPVAHSEQVPGFESLNLHCMLSTNNMCKVISYFYYLLSAD